MKTTLAHSLKDIKKAFATVDGLNLTSLAAIGLMALGWDRETLVAVIQALTSADFNNSYAARNNPAQMMDEYKPATR